MKEDEEERGGGDVLPSSAPSSAPIPVASPRRRQLGSGGGGGEEGEGREGKGGGAVPSGGIPPREEGRAAASRLSSRASGVSVLTREDSTTLTELRALHRLHASWVQAGFIAATSPTSPREETRKEEGDASLFGVSSHDGEDHGGEGSGMRTSGGDEDEGSGSGWFAPLRSSWAHADGAEADTDAITNALIVGTPTSPSFLTSARPSLMTAGSARFGGGSGSSSEDVIDAIPEIDAGHEEEELLESGKQDEEGDDSSGREEAEADEPAITSPRPGTSVRHMLKRSSDKTDGDAQNHQQSQQSVQSNQKSPQSSRRRLNLHLRTKSLISSSTNRISISNSFRLPRRQTHSMRDEEWGEGEVRVESRKGQYDGTYDSDGLKDGAGRFIYSDGSMYEGEWKNDRRHGFGTMVYTSGEKYQGQWVDDKKEGTGTYTWRQGFMYSGLWKNNQRHGRATYQFGNGDWYFEGDWIEDAPGPEGQLRGPQMSYIGQVMAVVTSARGMRHPPYTLYQNGHGRGSYPQGDRYFGTWKKGKRDAFGVYIVRQGDRFFGNWREDQPRGMGLWIHVDGTQYFGEFDKGRPSGKGQLRFANGDTLDGVQWNGDVVLKALYTRASRSRGKGAVMSLEPKWILFMGDALEEFVLTKDDLPLLESSPHLNPRGHRLELLLERWVSYFRWCYTTLPSYEAQEEVERQLRCAIDDVNSFIDHMVHEIRFSPEDIPGSNRGLLRRFVGRYVLAAVHATIFAIYRRVNKKIDARLAIKMKSLAQATPRDLGIADKFQLTQHLPSEEEITERQARSRTFLGSHKGDSHRASTAITHKRYPYRQAIKLLATLPNTPPAEKAQRLLLVSQAVIDAVQQYWQFRAPNEDVASMMGAEEKFPIFTYIVLKADIANLFSELHFIGDFIRQQYFNNAADASCVEAEAKYRLAELEAAVQYILTLDWKVRDTTGILVPRAALEQKLREFIGEQIGEPKLCMLAQLVVDLLIKISSSSEAGEVLVDDRPTVELMHQHPQWTVDLLDSMGLSIDLPLSPESETSRREDGSERGCDFLHQGKEAKRGRDALSSSASYTSVRCLIDTGNPNAAASASIALPSASPPLTPSALTVKFRVRHAADTYLRFAELLTRAAS